MPVYSQLGPVLDGRAEAATLAGWINGVRLLCTVYDPNSGRYTFDYSIFVGAAVGMLCLIPDAIHAAQKTEAGNNVNLVVELVVLGRQWAWKMCQTPDSRIAVVAAGRDVSPQC